MLAAEKTAKKTSRTPAELKEQLTAVSNEGLEYFDLVGKRRSRDGSIWESWDDHGQAY